LRQIRAGIDLQGLAIGRDGCSQMGVNLHVGRPQTALPIGNTDIIQGRSPVLGPLRFRHMAQSPLIRDESVIEPIAVGIGVAFKPEGTYNPLDQSLLFFL